MKKLLKLVLALFLIVIVMLAAVFGITLYYKFYSEDCRVMNNTEITSMMKSILQHKVSMSKDGKILFDYEYNNVKLSSIKHVRGRHSYDDSYDVTFSDKNTGLPLFIAAIYPNCEIHWMDKSD